MHFMLGYPISAATMPGYARQTGQSQMRRGPRSPKKDTRLYEPQSGSKINVEDMLAGDVDADSDNESLNSLPRVIDSVCASMKIKLAHCTSSACQIKHQTF